MAARESTVRVVGEIVDNFHDGAPLRSVFQGGISTIDVLIPIV